MVAAFLNLKYAYDSVDINTLVVHFQDMGLSSNIAKCIFELFHCKILMLKNDIFNLGERFSFLGLPQGSPLSPFLFNVYTASLKDYVTNGCDILQFADDFVLFSKHEDLSVAVRALNVALTKFCNWCNDHNFTISFSKTKAMVFTRKNSPQEIPFMVFTRKNSPQEIPFINVRGVRLEIVESIRYLV
ncbi:Reverse transcriptase (RNA-dependent DNA polymerase) [Popillia japonica]|uniref:Reverse transcriptase (RNA-dependent DNA polymerase) n=1 Tax=Popillia japonica TaxID=7064 RepID=A0AAW1K077_POPJA